MTNKKEFRNMKSRLMLYFASEPFDYNFDGHTYTDVYNLFNKDIKKIGTTTSVPRGRFDEIANFIYANGIDNIGISYKDYHKTRIKDFLKKYPGIKRELWVVNPNYFIDEICYDPCDEMKTDEWIDFEKNPSEVIRKSHVVLTPTGVYNAFSIDPTKQNPNGIILEKIKTGSEFYLIETGSKKKIFRKEKDYNTVINNIGKIIRIDDYLKMNYNL